MNDPHCTNPSLPARLAEGESLLGWVKLDSLKQHGIEYPKHRSQFWVADATGKTHRFRAGWKDRFSFGRGRKRVAQKGAT